jgi:signal transduction histidine kinase
MGVEIALDVHDHAMVVGDPGRLKQLFGILLDNAIRYTPGPGRIAIRLGASSEESEVVVADNGIGISKDDQPKVFERFYRGGRVAPESDSGAGLGLAIARAIAEAHHGRIILESARHEGTTVSVVLPQAPPPP